MTGSHSTLPRPPRRKDKSVKDLLSKGLPGLKNDYSEQVQAIVDEKKQKILDRGLADKIQTMKTRLDEEFVLVSELKTIS